MPFTGKVGDSIFIDDPGDGHRYVILTKPNSNDEVVIVNFTAERFDKDCTATFRHRDHSGLFSKPTVVNYPLAVIVPLVKFKNEATKSNCKYIYCPEQIIERIIIGAFQSQFTSMGVLNELKEQYPTIAQKYFDENDLKSIDNA